MHLFYDSVPFDTISPEELAERTKTFLSSRSIEFETVSAKNFESGDFMQSYIEVILGT